MIKRCDDGKLIDIKINNFFSDKEYYEFMLLLFSK